MRCVWLTMSQERPPPRKLAAVARRRRMLGIALIVIGAHGDFAPPLLATAFRRTARVVGVPRLEEDELRILAGAGKGARAHGAAVVDVH